MASEAVVNLTDDTFESEVLNSREPVLVDFWAEWCQPCKMLSPTMDEPRRRVRRSAKVTKMNIDDHRQVATQFGIMSIPTVLLFHNGEIKNTFVGLSGKDKFAGALDEPALGRPGQPLRWRHCWCWPPRSTRPLVCASDPTMSHDCNGSMPSGSRPTEVGRLLGRRRVQRRTKPTLAREPRQRDAEPVRLTTGDRDDRHPVFAPDSRTIAFYRLDDRGLHQAHVIPVGGGEAFGLAALPSGVDASVPPVWSPDGRTLLVTGWIEDGAVGEPVVERIGDAPMFSKWSSARRGLWLLDASGGRPDPIGPLGDFADCSEGVFADGGRTVYCTVVLPGEAEPGRALRTAVARFGIGDPDSGMPACRRLPPVRGSGLRPVVAAGFALRERAGGTGAFTSFAVLRTPSTGRVRTGAERFVVAGVADR